MWGCSNASTVKDVVVNLIVIVADCCMNLAFSMIVVLHKRCFKLGFTAECRYGQLVLGHRPLAAFCIDIEA